MYDFGGRDDQQDFNIMSKMTFLSPNETELKRSIVQIGNEITMNDDFQLKNLTLIEGQLNGNLSMLIKRKLKIDAEWNESVQFGYIGCIILLN